MFKVLMNLLFGRKDHSKAEVVIGPLNAAGLEHYTVLINGKEKCAHCNNTLVGYKKCS